MQNRLAHNSLYTMDFASLSRKHGFNVGGINPKSLRTLRSYWMEQGREVTQFANLN